MDYCPKCGVDWDGIHCKNCNNNINTNQNNFSEENSNNVVPSKGIENRSPEQIITKNTSSMSSFLAIIPGMAAGFTGMILGVTAWVAVGLLSNMEIGWISILIGYLTGIGMAIGAKIVLKENIKNINPAAFCIMAALLSFIGVYLGKAIYYSVYLIQHPEIEPGMTNIVRIISAIITAVPILGAFISQQYSSILFDLIFYALAVWFGYKETAKAFS
jgi:hypothetical protein